MRALSEAIAAAEREGGYAAAREAYEALSRDLPPAAVWRAHLELAECAKRGAAPAQVKLHLSQALEAQPRNVQVWLEACRTVEELGEAAESRALLESSLECCPPSNEQLVLKLVRVLERLGDYEAFRSLVGSLRREPLERVCKVLLEAAHVEVRCGSGEAARSLLRCMMQRVPHQGLVYCEASRVESVLGNWHAAMRLAEQGVQNCPKHGPLWFALVRHSEKACGAAAVREYAAHAVRNVCHELHWKFHFEVAGALSREGDIDGCRQSIGAAALNCPAHLRWKVWLLAARSELCDGSVEASRQLLARARVDAPQRMRAAVCLECARAEEYLHNPEAARTAVADAHACEGQDWKVFLEHIFMEARQGRLDEAKAVARSALALHPATGRLWSALIALEHSGDEGGVAAAMATYRRAAAEVPKSGEVWCEGARVFMNPMAPNFHIDRAHKCLEFALHLTPQYGDSFLELLRLRFLLEMRARMRRDPLSAGFLTNQLPPNGSEAGAKPKEEDDEEQRLVLAALVARRACDAVSAELRRFGVGARGIGLGPGGSSVEEGGSAEERRAAGLVPETEGGAPRVHLGQLDVICGYADPNYGFLWFWCRQASPSSPRDVLHRMRREIAADLLVAGVLWAYAWAIAKQLFGLPPSSCCDGAGGAGLPAAAESAAAEAADSAAAAASADDDAQGGLQPPLAARDFATGSMRLSRCLASGTSVLEEAERRRLIFGSDILCV